MIASRLLFAVVLAVPALAFSQTGQTLPIETEEATPIGALPPMPLPMPASRDQNYWGLRLQYGQRNERGGPEDLFAVAGGIDFQLRGGSIFGLTGGYQGRRNCQSTANCNHALFGARGRFNLFTGGPTVASIVGDESATTTIGTEVGFGYAPKTSPGVNACTIDMGVPLSVAMMQRLRIVAFATPGVVWDVDCSSENTSAARSALLGFGIGIQQLGIRGLDLNVGAQRIFRGATGMQFGISVSWVRLP
ncbi:MAG TPA: hypothetical protein VJ840_11725 [Gemmatimonadaceae bacterium]|nr:hypothetical protein [Gemmatimonadaceae bacterium]